jgi:hypothetical protein
MLAPAEIDYTSAVEVVLRRRDISALPARLLTRLSSAVWRRSLSFSVSLLRPSPPLAAWNLSSTFSSSLVVRDAQSCERGC